jgi:hypothetical protein
MDVDHAGMVDLRHRDDPAAANALAGNEVARPQQLGRDGPADGLVDAAPHVAETAAADLFFQPVPSGQNRPDADLVHSGH